MCSFCCCYYVFIEKLTKTINTKQWKRQKSQMKKKMIVIEKNTIKNKCHQIEMKAH